MLVVGGMLGAVDVGPRVTSTVRYQGWLADSARWNGFAFRDDDILISTPSKCGTTWTQMLVALLVFGGPEFPEPLHRLSPWLDALLEPLDEVYGRLEAQHHRRLIKTHVPLDGLPRHGGVTYVVVGRDPRDVLVSGMHHVDNLDIDRLLALRNDVADGEPLPSPTRADGHRALVQEFLTGEFEADPTSGRLASVLHHLDTGWQRRHEVEVVLLHYADLQADLPGELRRLAERLGYDLDEEHAVELAAEASLDRMRARAKDAAPESSVGLWKDPQQFFRKGASGDWRELLNDDDLDLYHRRVAALVDEDMTTWLHGGRVGSGVHAG